MSQTLIKEKKSKNIYLALFLYWVILLLWQNVRSAANRDTVDTAIKAGLIFLLSVYFFFQSRNMHRNVLIVFFFYVFLYAFTRIPAATFELADVMYYFFPLVLFLVTLGMGGSFTITKTELVRLGYMLTAAVLYIVLFAIITQPEKFLEAVKVQNAYGNELSSFLASSHEFGYYLSFGIVAAGLCLELDDHMNSVRRAYLIIVIVLFAISLILTFSRTAILAFLSILLWYVFASGKRKMKKIVFVIVVIFALVIICIRPVREYTIHVVFKNNNDAGREEMAYSGIQIFKNAPIYQALFGYDRQRVYNYLAVNFRHGNFHNAYIQTLVCNGVIGLLFPLGCFAYGVYHILRTQKLAPEWKRLSNLFYSFIAAMAIVMMFQTTCLFASSIDSFFLTFFCFLLPIYVDNAIIDGTFDPELQQKLKEEHEKKKAAENKKKRF